MMGRKESGVDINLPASVVMALSYANQLQEGTLRVSLKGGGELVLKKPTWSGFDAFDRITSPGIRRIRRILPAEGKHGFWVLETEVWLFHYDRPLVRIKLTGMKPDGEGVKGAGYNNSSAWAVSKISYFQVASGLSLNDDSWKEIELEASFEMRPFFRRKKEDKGKIK
jgi:hypothetical protein